MRKIVLSIFITLFALHIKAQSFAGQLGYGVSPLGHSADFSQFGAFLSETAGLCNGNGVVFVNANWRDNITSAGLIPTVHKTVSLLQPSPYNYIDMLAFPFAEYPTLFLNTVSDSTNNWTNSNMKQLFLQMLIHTADSLQPEYIFIGNEVSFYWEQDSTDYLNFVSFYHQAYDSIKLYSPATKVGTIFNYEHLSGHGTNVGWSTPHWTAITSIDTSRIDVYGLTVYPFFEYNAADSVPSNYLNDFFQLVNNKEVYLTETGWPADSFIGTWTCSPAKQEIYIDTLVNIVANGNVIGMNWLYLHYLMDPMVNDGIKIFNSVSLRDSLGNDRPALNKWVNLCTATSLGGQTGDTQQIRLYPNPAAETVTVSGEHLARIEIINSLGQVVYSSNAISSGSEIFIGGLTNGCYVIRVMKEDQTMTTRELMISH